MRFSIQSIKKLVTTGTWKIGGTWDAIGFVGLAMGVAVCLVDSRSFAIACLAAVKSRGGGKAIYATTVPMDVRSSPLPLGFVVRTILRIVSK